MKLLLVVLLLLAGCASPQVVVESKARLTPRLSEDAAVMSDGYRLPLRRWGSGKADIVLLGLHGFNDYSRSIEPLGRDLAKAGITTYAVDQRGFGGTAEAGRWHGSIRLARDVRELTALLRQRHPHARLYVAGESMGGAVAMLAASMGPLDLSGIVLIAPAVWSRDTMPWYQRILLDLAVHTAPGLNLTGDGLDLHPTDNDAELEAMSADPLVIKGARVDALWGIADLMDAAQAYRPPSALPVLILYGERDEIIPRNAFCRMIGTLPAGPAERRIVLYARGWHLLPRDLQGERVRADIAAWIQDPGASLPSGEEARFNGQRLQAFCKDGIDGDQGWPSAGAEPQ